MKHFKTVFSIVLIVVCGAVIGYTAYFVSTNKNDKKEVVQESPSLNSESNIRDIEITEIQFNMSLDKEYDVVQEVITTGDSQVEGQKLSLIKKNQLGTFESVGVDIYVIYSNSTNISNAKKYVRQQIIGGYTAESMSPSPVLSPSPSFSQDNISFSSKYYRYNYDSHYIAEMSTSNNYVLVNSNQGIANSMELSILNKALQSVKFKVIEKNNTNNSDSPQTSPSKGSTSGSSILLNSKLN